MSIRRSASVAALLIAIGATPAFADMEAAKKWVDSEFQPSTLSKDQQMKEMEWFVKAAEPFKGMEINVLSEDIPTHHYEAEVLALAGLAEDVSGMRAVGAKESAHRPLREKRIIMGERAHARCDLVVIEIAAGQ